MSKPKKVKAKAKGITYRRLALLWGEMALSALDHGKWFGPSGKAPALCDIPDDYIVKAARRAGRYALKHRERYPLKGQANA